MFSQVEKQIAKVKNASPAKIEKISNKVAQNIIAKASTPKAAEKVVKKLIKQVKKDPNATVAAKKAVAKIAQKVVQKLEKEVLPHNVVNGAIKAHNAAKVAKKVNIKF